ncbi:HtrA protease/chaperone protein / Serine protease (Protease DO) [hydrothermal vent metagenome]|uniref:HtrA protease/chaperone protein / Serine protease (Protease DO) n=1 Tax=hydrothermal vent metagenome TaxID=652676 RepID=A0A1W1BC97_9ZZZZ
MKKIVVAFMVLVSFIYAKSIDFQYANSYKMRKFPANGEYILSYNNVLSKVKNSVVNISIQKNIKINQTISQFFNDPFFKQFFGNKLPQQIPQERVQRALGSGVIVSEDGYIITNNHVIDGADKITVTIPGDKKEYEAKLIGRDAKSDIAVIKIEKKDLIPVEFFDSDRVKVGDVVFAIGNPFGVGETVTHGIVSAVGRNSMGIEEYENFIQTDAPINPGNSGGALLNSSGELIGINTAIVTRSGSSAGIGFAIPSNMVRSIAKQLIEKGVYKRGYLGVSITDVSSDMSSFYGGKFGALVTSVGKDTPAKKVGLKRGDLIIAVDGKKVDSASALKNLIGTYQPGATVTLTFIRDKATKQLKVKLASYDNAPLQTDSAQVTYKGMSVEPLTATKKSQMGISTDIQGVVVTDIKPKSPAYEEGILKGDIIIQIEDKEIKSLNDFKKAIKSKAKKRVWIYRQGAIFAVVL